jgi:Fur family ferric uptake transcriptional regulator
MADDADVAAECARVERLLARRGLRHSRQRGRVIAALAAAEGHLTAEELAARARREVPRVGLATVYRTLRLLVRCGCCRELKLEDGSARFELIREGEHHDHLVCLWCGAIIEVADAEIERLQERLCRRHGFAARRHHLAIYGRCRGCRETAAGDCGGRDA